MSHPETPDPDHPQYVRFPFADRPLVGRVVGRELDSQFDNPFRTRLTVDVDGERFTVYEGDATPLDDAPDADRLTTDTDAGGGR